MIVTLIFLVQGHDMTVVEANGSYVQPFAIRNLYIYFGETRGLGKNWQEPSRNYWETVNVISRKPATPTGISIFNYHSNQGEAGII